MVFKFAASLTLVGTLLLGACSNDGILGLTDTMTTTAALPEKPRVTVNPACAPLAAKITELRNEGSADRVAQAAQGKGQTVSVKRAALAKVTELDKANAEFQTKCSNFVATAGTNVAAAASAPSAAKTSAAPKATTATKTQ